MSRRGGSVGRTNARFKEKFLENEAFIVSDENLSESWTIKSSQHSKWMQGRKPRLIDDIQERQWLESQVRETWETYYD